MQPSLHLTEVSKNGRKLNVAVMQEIHTFRGIFSLVKSKSYFYNTNPASSQLKQCTTRKRCQGNPPGKPTKLFFFPAAFLICANINTFPGRREGGREVGRRETGTNPQVLRTTVLSLQLLECKERLKQMSQMDIEPGDTWE